MSRIETIRAEFSDFIPGTLQSGIIYVSKKYETASHLCCCGCGNKVVTPLKPGGWRLSTHGDTVTLYPSIGSWSLPCKSHYWIRGNKIIWARQWTQSEIEAARINDQRDRERYFDAIHRQANQESFWRRILRRIFLR